MTRVKFTADEVARRQNVIEKSRKQFVANDSKPKVDIRDYFFAAVLQGLCANPSIVDDDTVDEERVVRLANRITDEALLHGR